MKIRTVLALCLCVSVATLAATQVLSGDDKKPAGEMPGMTPEMMEMMQQCMENMAPGEHHKILNDRAGSWKTTTKMWMMGEGNGDPVVTTGTSEVTSILGGRFVMEKHNGSMIMPNEKGEMAPVEYNGVGLTGYDNDRNLYTGCWAQNCGTNLLTFKGGASRDGKTITMYGEMDEPMMKIVGRTVKYVTRFDSKDKHTFMIYDLHAGDNFKVIEIVYERK